METPDGADIADVTTYVIGECARFGTRLRTLTRRLGPAAAVAAEREELTQAIAYASAALADLLLTVHPVQHEDLQHLLIDRANGHRHPTRDRGPREPADAGAPGPATRQHPSVRDLPWVATA
ncbi:hypothetical protein [Nonomuraea sp. NPDC050786]|uniref:hypothetical protein n=1 Tax=Nonomuraea sp. NPDC050786 TaxID=3154840 RepID=UPI0033C18DF9